MRILISIILILMAFQTIAQETTCGSLKIEYTIDSKYLKTERTHWVGLPINFSDTHAYPVIYVLDAEWRFNLIYEMVKELGATKKMQPAIVIGIPHIQWNETRNFDLTFSQSRIEYDGDKVDSSWYNRDNSGNGMQFFKYLNEEVIPHINKTYSTSGHETIIGHSLGGYFAGFVLSLNHSFEVFHLYDPSIWYGNGEVINHIIESNRNDSVDVFIGYQPKPLFHKTKIDELIVALSKIPSVRLNTAFYENDTHMSLFLDSFYQGIQLTNK